MRVEITKHGKKYIKPETIKLIKIICPECHALVSEVKEKDFTVIEKKDFRISKSLKTKCSECKCEFIVKYK